MAGREIELLNDRGQARQRLSIFAGMDMPSTIVRKEILDNEIDVVNERGQKAESCVINIGPHRMQVMDDGSGISTSKMKDTGMTHLWAACAKMFSSSNYGGVEDTLGANGVGLTVANYTSRQFSILLFNNDNVQGYRFLDGYLCGTKECKDNVNANPKGFSDEEHELASVNGDLVKKPGDKREYEVEFRPPYDTGFMVDVTWGDDPSMFPDGGPNIDWLVNYVHVRTGEIKSGDVYMNVFGDDDFAKSEPVKKYHWCKNPDSEDYVKSWDEQVADAGAAVIKEGPWKIAFSSDPEMHIESVVQGAPVDSRYSHSIQIQIQDYVVRVSVPVSIKYLSTDYPKYNDQTKTSVRFPYSEVNNAFQRSGEVYRYFYREAEKAYMAKVIKDSESGMFWPALGPAEESELIIAEGYSAISGLKSQRDPMTQACIALRGKILNTWNLDMQKAMRADVVRQILNAVLNIPYKRVIIATDEDPDGAHIRSLLLACFARFTNIIQEGKVYYVHSPHYLFKKRGADLMWSDDAKDCPAGYHVTTLKGLGGMAPDEVSKFIMNEDTRELVKITWDRKAIDSLDHAFTEGGESWIIED